MKKINNKIAILLLALVPLVWSCGDEEPIFYSDGNFVAFQADAASIGEASGTTTIQITRSSTDLSASVTVNLTITGTYAESTGFHDAGDDATGTFTASASSVTFAAGEASQTITITGVDDSESSGSKTVMVAIADVSDASYNIGQPGPSAFRSSFSVSLVDDDCPFDISEFTGGYDIDIISEQGFGNPAGSFVSSTTLSVGTDPNTLLDANFWDFGAPGVITLDSSDPSNFTATLVGAPQFVYNNGAGLPRYAIQGTQPIGSFSTCDNSIIVNMELTREDQATIANRSMIIYTKQ